MQRIQNRLNSPEPCKWLFSGDSITHGALHTNGARDYTQLFTERLRYELNRGRDIIFNTAYSGRTTREILADFAWGIEQFSPDVVFLMVGMNDCKTVIDLSQQEFAANLREIGERILQIPGCTPVFQTTCTILDPMAIERAKTLPVYMEIVRSVAAELGVPLVDHTRYWQQLIAEKPVRQHAWMNDSIHPNAWGHQVFAECLFKALGIFDAEAPSGRFFRP